MKRIVTLLLALILVLTMVAGCNNTPATTTGAPTASETKATESQKETTGDMKVAMLLSGPANDQGWNAAAVDGLKAIEAQFGLETSFLENVQVADMEAAFNDYAAQGYNLVIGHGFQFGEPAAKVSKTYPDQYFMATESSSKSANMASYVMACEEGAYMLGTLAAMMTKTKVIGVVGGIEQPSITKELEAFKAAALAYDPDIKVLTAYCNSFTDVTAGQSAATAMINQDADVLYHVANQAGTGVIKAAEEKNLYCLGNSYDQSSIAPSVLLASTVYNLPGVVVRAYEDIQAGTFGDAILNLGVDDGIVDIVLNEALIEKIGEDNVKKLEEMKAGIADGSIDVPLIETPSK